MMYPFSRLWFPGSRLSRCYLVNGRLVSQADIGGLYGLLKIASGQLRFQRQGLLPAGPRLFLLAQRFERYPQVEHGFRKIWRCLKRFAIESRRFLLVSRVMP